MNLIAGLAILYVSYYTMMYARMIWKKENNKLGAFFVILLAFVIVGIPLWEILR
ncbi:hypothetical protein [Orenia marismortui]|uniref:Uncharacterized protein n=1 Tax=Orenia marismortui TaxID=46469 RepID=A0A4R8H0L7_9FIRM|nr:hypothetical protein [Orenia marismortui]TDX48033.1 hypothetical protein C7959_13319 [Orenia marismortui]